MVKIELLQGSQKDHVSEMSPIARRASFAGILLMLLFTSVVPAISDPTTDGWSIDCGSNKNYTGYNKIPWVTDTGFIATGKNEQNLTVSGLTDSPPDVINAKQSGDMRFFDQGRGRDCYVLPVDSGFTYLVRPTFYYGNSTDRNNTANLTVFDVYLNGNQWINFQFDREPDYTNYEFEALVYVTTNSLDVCLVRLAGIPFISSLELRKFDHGMYSTVVGNQKYLLLSERLNTGANSTEYAYVRYPDDPYDRIWPTPGSWDNATHVRNTTNIISSSESLTPEKPPVKVMEDYWIYPNSDVLWLLLRYGTPVGPIAAYSYYQEISANYNASNVRGMDYYVNDFLLDSFNTSDQRYEVSSCLLNIAETFVNITLKQASWSTLKPILNAIEIYFVLDWNDSTTAIEDVTSVNALQRLFNMEDWFGDPCIPVPYDWLTCEIPVAQASTTTYKNDQTNLQGVTNNTAYVTSVSLANIAIVQKFPEEVIQFSLLTTLNLSNTSIPSVPSNAWNGVGNLTVLDLSNNKLSGGVADFVQNITGAATNLQRLDASNNFLEGEFPLDHLYDQFPNLKEANFDGNSNISGTLDMTRFLTALISGNNTANNTVKVAATPSPAGTASTFPLISLRNNKITDITPGLDALSGDINNYLRSLHSLRMSFNNVNGILLAGNPWCERTNYNQQTLPQQYLCRSTSSDSLPGIGSLSSSKRSSVGAIVGGAVGGVAFLFFILFLAVIIKLYRRTSSLKEIQEALARQKVQPPFFSYASLRAATNDFSHENKLGQGSFGAVYKGRLLDTTDGTQELVAVKKLYPSSQALSEFLNEAVLITGIKHRNLVQLKGCCIYKDDQRMLVYEYAENGNLAEALLDVQVDAPDVEKLGELETRLDWQQRLKICVGIARGLSYLHEELQPRIIHRDIKPGNILLDRNYNAKIADFGLARSILEGRTEADFTQIAGTKGYFSPEYATQGQLTEKADVFSFGVVLLEIVSGRKWRDDRLPREKQFLQAWARHLRNEAKLLDLLDPRIRKTANDEEVIRVITLAFLCLEFDPSQRPTMSEAVTMLQGIMSVTLYKADSDIGSPFPSPIGGASYKYMKLPSSLGDLSEDLPVDSFNTNASSSANISNHVELSRLSGR